MTALNLWLDDTFTKHADLDAALDAITEHPLDISECWVRDPQFQTVRVYSAEELADELKIRKAEIAADNSHNATWAAE